MDDYTTLIIIAAVMIVVIVVLRLVFNRVEDVTVAEVKALAARGETEAAVRVIDEWIEHNSLEKGNAMGYPGLGAGLDHDRKVRKLMQMRAELVRKDSGKVE